MTKPVSKYDAVVVGLGLTGLSYARYLHKQGKHFAVTDSRDLPPELARFKREFAHVDLTLGSFDPHLMLNTQQLLLSPGVSDKHETIVKAKAAGVQVCGDIELFCQQVSAPIIAVTGSNGKSTVVSLVQAMALQAGINSRLGGNIGTPVLQLLDEPESDLYVLELSSFQLELTNSLNAVAAVVLNVSEDHMDRYATLADYAKTKARIYQGSGVTVLNKDDVNVASMRQAGRNVVAFTENVPADNEFGIKSENGATWLMHADKKLVDVAQLRLKGKHNYLNILAAFALCEAASIPLSACIQAAREFHGLPHRCEFVAETNQVAWYNDSKGTNVGASCAAIESLAQGKNIILIAGGEGKGADFSPLKTTAKNHVKFLVTIGKDGPLLAETLAEVVEHAAAPSMPEAVRLAHARAGAGDIVLLSPACASLDMFKDYTDRGRCFIDAVNGLEQQNV